MVNINNEIDINEIVSNLIEKNFEKICCGIKGYVKDKTEKIKVDYNIAFSEYLKKAYSKYSKIKTLLYRTEPKYLYDFFECNTLAIGSKRIAANDINNILDISKYIIIQGTGGIGKSTMMKHFFLNELEKNDLIPVFIELKDLNNFNGDLTECIYNSLYRLGFNLEKKYFEYALSGGCFLFLLDGCDEIFSNRYDSFFKELDELCDKYSDNYYIVSSRPNDTFITFQRFTVLDSLAFSKKQSLSLIKKLEYDEEIKARFIKKLESTLYDKHQSFASNPLLLNIMLLTFDNYAEIPDKLHIFYSNAFETLYTKHDATKAGYKREMLSKLSYDDFKIVFAKFCFNTYIKQKIEFTHQELLDYLNVVKKNSCDFEVSDYIKDLIYSVCVLYNDGKNYKFTHRSFQEYFTSFYLKELSDEQQEKACLFLIENFGNKNDQVLNMLFDMAQERFEKNIIIPVLESLEKTMNTDDDKYYRYFKCIVDKITFRLNKGELQLLLRTDGNLEKENFIIGMAFKYRKFFGTLDLSSDKDYEERMIEEFKKDPEINELVYSCKEILKDEQLFNYINKSWIRDIIYVASELLDTLRQKQMTIINDLDDLLNFQ